MIIQQKLYAYLEKPQGSMVGWFVQIAIFTNIAVNVLILFLLTEKSLQPYLETFYIINDITMSFFVVEYLLRHFSSGVDPRYRGISGKIKYALRPFMLIDLIVLLPFFLRFLGIEIGFLRLLRFVRIFRLFRMAKFGEFDEIIVSIVKDRKEEFLYVLIMSFLFLIVLSSLIYEFEHDVQPEVFSSMFASMWWAIITFTTVGYGDMYPVTVGGKIITTITIILGITFYAIPVSLFTSSLLEKINEKKQRKKAMMDARSSNKTGHKTKSSL